MTHIDFSPYTAHTYRNMRTIAPAHLEAAVDWCEAIRGQDGVLKLANLFADLHLFAEMADEATGGRASADFLARLLASFGAPAAGDQ